MAISILTPPTSSEPPLTRKRFTRAEVERMTEIGLFEGQRFELIGGDLIDKMGQKPPHAHALPLCMIMLLKIFAAELVRVSYQWKPVHRIARAASLNRTWRFWLK